MILEATVKAAGLSSREHVRVVVDGLVGDVPTHLFDARIGPGSNGVVDQTLKIPIPIGSFERLAIAAIGDPSATRRCVEDNPREGCAIIWLPAAATSPGLSMSWMEGAEGTRELEIKLTGSGFAPQSRLRLMVFGMKKRSTLMLASEEAALTTSGGIDQTFTLPVNNGLVGVCAVALPSELVTEIDEELWASSGRCPQSLFKSAVWVTLELPSAPKKGKAGLPG